MEDRPADQTEAATSELIQSRLRALFAASPPGRAPYTEHEVAVALTKAGHKITANGIRHLLKAPRINPKASTVRGLAKFFNVPVGYLLGDSKQPEDPNPRVRVMTRSITKLSPAAQDGLQVIIDNLLRVEEDARGGESRIDTQRPDPDRRQESTDQ
ncbi:hypothetical protein [Micromonospora peucetia]|uniref:HTH cro/C1-type domain-containing protein n=1 Tax=Micromonospora peucetia TaxID=47871 RepID=A0A1C6W556_9ACTN|nr:hypothetical protein [Micromonospora peucetia]SCL73662.1 hypothetical protein GA0070608_5972 [Micromonospora peucetia]